MLFLAGDIGGTKAFLQLIVIDKMTLEMTPVAQQRYLCNQYTSFEEILCSFLSSYRELYPDTLVHSACFGLPGPVDGRCVELTNLPWVVDADRIEATCGIDRVQFVNDFYAAALGVDVLAKEDVHAIYLPEGQSDYPLQGLLDIDAIEASQVSLPKGHRLVVGAGTGLGVAPVFFDGQGYLPVSSEGGHFDFAPISYTQQVLLSWLWTKWEHVSYERVLSGPGLETLYEFFLQFDLPASYYCDASEQVHKNKGSSTQNILTGAFFADMLLESDGSRLSAVEIYNKAEQGDAVAVKALTEFVTIYGAFVGAVALVWNAPYGVFLAGGIAQKMLHWLEKPYFKKAFLEKGRMSKVVAKMPIFVVVDESLGLRGAMHQNLLSWQASQK